MAELRPFRALRYNAGIAGDVAAALAPPYDIIDAAEQAALYQRSPHNVIRLELAEERPGDGPEKNRYTRAAATLSAWRRSKAVIEDEEPGFYLYAQEFEHGGRRLRRTALFGRLRLEPWETGSVRPHEETMVKPKEDRLQLLRHLRTNVSPVFALYREDAGRVARLLRTDATVLVDATTPDGQRHSLSVLRETAAIETI